MEESIRSITRALVGKIPTGQEYLQPDDLRSRDIPSFITGRVEMEMEKNLKESLTIPDNEWADLSRPEVSGAWENFLDTASFGLRLPAAHAPGVFETAVEESLAILVQPRKHIPEILFGQEKSLKREILERRLNIITVYKHLAFAVLRYADKKNLGEITFEQCKNIISRVDEKLTADYNTAKWIELLDPLFQLTDNQVDSDLLRLFFEEKEKHDLARYFDRMKTPVTRAGLIDVLSLPEIPDHEDEIEEADALEDTGPDDENREVQSIPGSEHSRIGEEPEEQDEEASFNVLFASVVESTQLPESEDDEEDPVDDAENEMLTGDSEIDNDNNVVQPLHTRFYADTDASGQEAGDEDDENPDMDSFNSTFLFDEDPPGNEIISHEQTTEPDSKRYDDDTTHSMGPGEPERVPDSPYIAEVENPDDEEASVWQNFIGDDDVSSDYEEEESAVVGSGFWQELAEQESNRVQADSLLNWLKDDKQQFVDEIFNGSEKAYEEAVAELASMDNWKAATHFIESRIFSQSPIDLFDEPAVDFTDRLHAYFTDYK